MIRILLADDHQILLDGIRQLIAKEEDMSVLEQARHGEEVLAKLQKQKIDVVLLDINMPGKDGMEICQDIKDRFPTTKVLVLSMHTDAEHITSMLKRGANGYVSKNAAFEEIVDAIRAVFHGETYFSNEISQSVMRNMAGITSAEEETITIRLSRREREVLNLIVEEFTTQEIAEKLFISIKTVETHRKNLLTKLNARNTAGLVRIAMEKGLI